MKNTFSTITRTWFAVTSSNKATANVNVRAKLAFAFLLTTAFISHSQTTTQNHSDMNKINSKTIVLIHGVFVNYQTWDDWKAYFESKGYTVIVPAWPYKNATAAELRNGKHD